ncbi:MAG: hypothetical protein ACXAEI_07075, partial [Candidatus Hodarchaeales archaeon]
ADYSPIYLTNASNPDTDGDRLPDGAEILYYKNDPRNPDQNQNGVPDGLDNDTDHDLLEDGLEFFGYVDVSAEGNETTVGTSRWSLTPTGSIPEGNGGFLNPDSDHDALADGWEYYGYGTNSSNSDTDGDGFSDGLEVTMGTDPLAPEMDPSILYEALDSLNGTVFLLLPREVKESNVPLIAKVMGNTTTTQLSYRIRPLNDHNFEPKSDWSYPELLTYNPKHDQWEGSRYLKDGYYEIEVTAVDQEGKSDVNRFLVRIGEISHESLLDKIPKPIIAFSLGLFLGFGVLLGLAVRQSSIKWLKRPSKEWEDAHTPAEVRSEEDTFGKEDSR